MREFCESCSGVVQKNKRKVALTCDKSLANPNPGRVYCLYTHVRPKTQNTRAQSINTLEAHTHHSNTTVQAPSLRAAHLGLKRGAGGPRTTFTQTSRCATAAVPTASPTSQAPISTTQTNSAPATLHSLPCAALRHRSSLSIFIYMIYIH